MPVYTYKAKVKPHTFRTGTIEADSEKAAVTKLLNLNYHPVDLKLKTEASFKNLKFFNRITNKDVYVFLRQLSNLSIAGLPLVKALNNIYLQSSNLKFKEVILNIKEKIQRGKSFSETMDFHKDIFNSLEINMIKAAESTGTLAEVIGEIADLREKDIDLKRKIRSALAYPTLLVFVGFITLFVLTSFVLPRFTILFDDLGQQLPWITQVLLAISIFSRDYYLVIFFMFFTGVYIITTQLKTEKGKIKLDSFLLKIPFLRNIIINLESARFTRTLGSLVANGVPIMNALKITGDVAVNLIFRQEIMQVHALVAKGQHISHSLQNSEIFDRTTIDLIAAGEESGRLEEMLFRIADMNESEFSQKLEAVLFLLEPMLILGLGIIIALIVMAILLPIFQMNFLIQ
ncbi:MAG: type II secretion system F family protein [Candidatus Omnitrophota bacterium]